MDQSFPSNHRMLMTLSVDPLTQNRARTHQERGLRMTLIEPLVMLFDGGKEPSQIGYNVHSCRREDKDLSMEGV